MKYADINKRFTDIVADYISAGWVINTSGVTAGYSGERMRVELTNGKDILAVRIVDHFTDRAVDIVTGIAKSDVLRQHYVRPNRLDHETLWADHITELSRETFFSVAGDHSFNWFGSKEEQEQAQEIRRARAKARGFCDEEDITEMRGAKEVALRHVQRMYSSYKLKDIERVSKRTTIFRGKEDTHYYIKARGKTFCLH